MRPLIKYEDNFNYDDVSSQPVTDQTTNLARMARPRLTSNNHHNHVTNNDSHSQNNKHRGLGRSQHKLAHKHKPVKRATIQPDLKQVTSGPLNNVTGQRNAFPIVLDGSYDYDEDMYDENDDDCEMRSKRTKIQNGNGDEMNENETIDIFEGYEDDDEPPMDAMTYLLQVRKEAEKCPSFVTRNKFQVNDSNNGDGGLELKSMQIITGMTDPVQQTRTSHTGVELNYGDDQGTTGGEYEQEIMRTRMRTELDMRNQNLQDNKNSIIQSLTVMTESTSSAPKNGPTDASEKYKNSIICYFKVAKEELVRILTQTSLSSGDHNSDTEKTRVKNIVKSLPNNFTLWRKFILNPNNYPSYLLLSQPEFDLALIYKLLVYCEQLVNKKIDRNLSLWIWSLLVRVPDILAGEEIGMIRSLAKKCARVKKNMLVANNHKIKKATTMDKLTDISTNLDPSASANAIEDVIVDVDLDTDPYTGLDIGPDTIGPDADPDTTSETRLIAMFSLDMVVTLVGVFWRQFDLLTTI